MPSKLVYPVGEGQYALGTRNKLLRRVGHITTFALCRAFITKSPFHRGGVTVEQKGENRRTRRIYEEEEKRLLGAARMYEMTGTGNRVLTPDTVAEIRSRAAAGDRQIDIAADFRISSGLCNQIVRNIIWNPEKWKARETTGEELHDQIIGALDTGCRQEEMERIQNDYVDWTLHEIRMPARTNKSDIARNIPFDPRLTRRDSPEAAVHRWAEGLRVRQCDRRVEADLAQGLGERLISRTTASWSAPDNEKARCPRPAMPPSAR